MAVRSKKGGYEVYWRDPATGKQRGRFFKTRKEADREDRRIRHLLQFDREKLLLESGSSSSAEFSFNAVWVKFFAMYGAEMCRTVRKRWKMILGRYGETDIRMFTTESYIDVYTWLSDRGWKPQSILRIFFEIGRILKFARDIGRIREVPKRCRVPSFRYERPVPPSLEELAKLYENAPRHLKRVIVLGAGFGIRVGPCELFSLKWSDVDFDEWVIHLRSSKKNRGVVVRTLPIPEKYRKLFLEWRERDADRFETVVNFRGQPVSEVRCSWANLLRKVGIERKLHPYDLRHAFATNMLEAGVDIGTVAKLMGHSGPAMIVNHYQYVREERKLTALSKIASFI